MSASCASRGPPLPLDHPNVIPLYDAGEADGVLYIAMRFVDGVDLSSLIASEGKLEPARTARIVAQVASALDAAHEAGLVHRDVKPGNVRPPRAGPVAVSMHTSATSA